ncbi:GntR family transcriptional regulator [Roseinatronobacter alkalisoli]|uniref:GntR family transcriptional regulator n=1 Tax=Roseinatronobacter alkalisoli TaxID=3028235 RepID=A0ABT5TCR9_9RHOB|nr:GntR family transcriptional regulator [Roseinatronobacter sp. HJB301]MDD7972801.1 GntR family transcriptional regulator [Roseinatronobacter sp. HJB301]
MDGRITPATMSIYDALRDRIITLDIAPGALLSRAGIMQQFDTSATPIREALRALRDEGLVEIHPQASTRVSRIDLSQATQTHFLRSTLEQAIVAQIAETGASGVHAELSSIVELQRDCVAANDLAGFRQLDLAFHQTLFRATDRLALYKLIRRESGHIDRIRALHLPRADKTAQILTDHDRIVTALRLGDPQLAKERMRLHLSHTIALGPALKQEFPAYFV